MSQPIFGPAALAWKITQHPQYWIPLILIFAAAMLGIYLLLPGIVSDPMPALADVKEMYISWDASGSESSFKKIQHEQYYPLLYESMSGGFASTKEPGQGVIATVRVITQNDKTTVIKFFETDLITINGKCYDRTRGVLFLQEAEYAQ